MKNKILFSLSFLLVILATVNVSYAAIEIVPSKNGKGTDAIVNTTVSNSFLQCQAMKDYGGSLYGTTVRPHLATNKDWGAVSYLSNSIYGTNTAGKNDGIVVTINNVKYYSTTPNITGVMNWGGNPNETQYTHTAYVYDDTLIESVINNFTALIENKNTDYVETKITKGMAILETSGLFINWSVATPSTGYPNFVRKGLFGYGAGNAGSWEARSTGAAKSDVTFRPVIWN